MALRISDPLKQRLGFNKLGEREPIAARFTSITAFELRGITLKPERTVEVSGQLAGTNYGIAVGTSVNEACRVLLQDDFVDDEAAWREEKSAKGPFVLVKIGPLPEHRSATAWIKRIDDTTVQTLDAFGKAREDLSHLEGLLLPRVMTALACVLSVSERHVQWRNLERAFAGRTAEGMLIHDIRFEVHGHATFSLSLDPKTLTENVPKVPAVAAKLNPQAARSFALGMGEHDELKRFLFFFLSLEVETNAVFKRIDHAGAVSRLLDGAGPQAVSRSTLIVDQMRNLNTLANKFVWCVSCVWTSLTDQDVDDFRLMKKARDEIAHGKRSEPPTGFALKAERLARRILTNSAGLP